MLRRLTLLLFPLIFSLPLSTSDASVYPPKSTIEKDNYYTLSGEITKNDVEQVRRIIQQNPGRGWGRNFSLDSSGGDVYAAIDIGRLIRKARWGCMVLEDQHCSSACVLILAGGATRLVLGEVAIHRPYSNFVGKRDYKSVENEYRKMESAVSSYLKEMNLPHSLFEAMVRVPPEQARVLSKTEVNSFGLDQSDPVDQELEDSQMSALYGIPKREYLERKAAADSECPPSPTRFPRPQSYKKGMPSFDVDKWIQCKKAFMYGISTWVYQTRVEKANSTCSSGDVECRGRIMRGER